MISGDAIRKKRKDLAVLLKVRVDNLYKWEKGTTPTDPEDYMKVDNWLNGKIENVPKLGEPQATAGNASQYDIQKLIDANHLMAEAMAADARSREKLTDSNNELVRMVKDGLTANAQRQSEQDANAMRSVFLELLAEVGSGKRWKSAEEVRAVYRKRIAAALGLTEAENTQRNLDKTNKVK